MRVVSALPSWSSSYSLRATRYSLLATHYSIVAAQAKATAGELKSDANKLIQKEADSVMKIRITSIQRRVQLVAFFGFLLYLIQGVLAEGFGEAFVELR